MKLGSKKLQTEATATGSERILVKRRFTVVIFGSARIQAADPHYQQVYRLAKAVGAQGWDVLTGGGPGLMEAANMGVQDGRKDSDARSLGFNIELPQEQAANRLLDIKKDFHLFSRRLDAFMALADAVVIAPGGVGTLLEFFYTWQLTQVRKIDRIPIILLGPMWADFMEWIHRWPLRNQLLSLEDFQNVFLVRSVPSVLRLIHTAYKAFQAGQIHSCLELKQQIRNLEC